jgi:hypothetical protein
MSDSFLVTFRDQPQLTQSEVEQFISYQKSGRRGSPPGATKARQQYIGIKISNAIWMLTDSSMTPAKMEQQYHSALPVPTPQELSLVRKYQAELTGRQ